jgi:hypothetical protein
MYIAETEVDSLILILMAYYRRFSYKVNSDRLKNLSSQSQALGFVAIDNPSSTARISWRRTCSFPEMRKKNQHFDKVRRYSKSRFLLTDFCKATHPTATALRLGWGPILDRNIRNTVSPRIYLSRAVNAVCF